MQRQDLLAVALLVAVLTKAPAAEWQVATNGAPTGQGTKALPWDLESTLQGKRGVQPGDTIWLQSGTYRAADRRHGAMGYEVRLAGVAGQPILVRALPRQRVTIDGGLNLLPPASYVWLRDLEVITAENLGQSRRIEESGSHPQRYDRPWGGLNINTGTGCKFIHLVIHDNAQGASWWSGSEESELYGCVIYDNGWDAPDRGHGHAIYTQNREGVKTIADCIMTGGHSYTLHAYGSSRADVDNYRVEGNIVYNAGPFLLGSGKPSHQIQVLTNYLYGVSMQLGYNATFNEDCEVLGNVIVNGSLTINRYRRVVDEGNWVLAKYAPRPAGVRVVWRPSRYDPQRAHLAVFNWEGKSPVRVELGSFCERGDKYSVLDPRNSFGQPIATGAYDGQELALLMNGEFAAFILLKTPP